MGDLKKAAAEMANLYTWETIVSILEGSSGVHLRDGPAQRVIKIAKAEQQRHLRAYDKAATPTPAPQAQDGQSHG